MNRFGGRSCCGCSVFDGSGRAGRIIGFECGDDFAVVLGRLAASAGDILDDVLDAVDCGQNDGDRVLRRRHSVSQHAHDGFGRVAYPLEALEAEEARGALDGVDETEDAGDQRSIGGVTFELDELRLCPFDMLRGFRQKIFYQLVHSG